MTHSLPVPAAFNVCNLACWFWPLRTSSVRAERIALGSWRCLQMAAWEESSVVRLEIQRQLICKRQTISTKSSSSWLPMIKCHPHMWRYESEWSKHVRNIYVIIQYIWHTWIGFLFAAEEGQDVTNLIRTQCGEETNPELQCPAATSSTTTTSTTHSTTTTNTASPNTTNNISTFSSSTQSISPVSSVNQSRLTFSSVPQPRTEAFTQETILSSGKTELTKHYGRCSMMSVSFANRAECQRKIWCHSSSGRGSASCSATRHSNNHHNYLQSKPQEVLQTRFWVSISLQCPL